MVCGLRNLMWRVIHWSSWPLTLDSDLVPHIKWFLIVFFIFQIYFSFKNQEWTILDINYEGRSKISFSSWSGHKLFEHPSYSFCSKCCLQSLPMPTFRDFFFRIVLETINNCLFRNKTTKTNVTQSLFIKYYKNQIWSRIKDISPINCPVKLNLDDVIVIYTFAALFCCVCLPLPLFLHNSLHPVLRRWYQCVFPCEK